MIEITLGPQAVVMIEITLLVGGIFAVLCLILGAAWGIGWLIDALICRLFD